MIWALIPGPVKRFMAWLIAGLAVLWAAWGLGRRDARQKAALWSEKSYRETRERIDHATDDIPLEPDLLREWLRQRGRQ
jgi:predicted membrane metal-binding protein